MLLLQALQEAGTIKQLKGRIRGRRERANADKLDSTSRIQSQRADTLYYSESLIIMIIVRV